MKIYCNHCETVYHESQELIHIVPATRYEPGDEITVCPECFREATDNMEATPEQIEYFNNY